MASTTNMASTRKFSLRAPVESVLESILADYPGGQMLQEGLQNADDAGATKFALMLDLRDHPTDDLREAGLARAQCEAMLLFDNGGFDDKDWTSFQNLHKSEKRKSPLTTGKYGMGSRSYFHYTDLVTVVSGPTYACLDPRGLVSEDFGFAFDIEDGTFASENASEIGPLLQPQFGCSMKSSLKGTLFRLPLRNDEDAATCTYAPHAITTDRAKELLHDFVNQLDDGKLMLFLEHVREIEIWKWDAGAALPNLLAKQEKVYMDGAPATRLPHELRDHAETFDELHIFLTDPPVLHQMVTNGVGQPCAARVQTSVSKAGDGNPVARQWLVCNQFCLDDELLNAMPRCDAIPAIGIALPLPDSAHDVAERIEGTAFCFLPLPIPTGLPVHVHACFQVAKNRRSLWTAGTGVDGVHQVYVDWNQRMLSEALPALYASVLEAHITPASLGGDLERYFGLWPFMGSVTADGCFDTLLPSLYRKLKQRPVLPVTDQDGQLDPVLVPPESVIVYSTDTPSQEAQRGDLLNLCRTAQHRSCFSGPVVQLPAHIQESLSMFIDLQVHSFEWVVEQLVTGTVPDPDLLGSPLLAVAEALGRGGDQNQALRWKTLIADVGNWLPLHSSNSLSTPEAAYDPTQPDTHDFHVARLKMPAVELPQLDQPGREAILRTLCHWGLRRHLTLEDALQEARLIETEASTLGATDGTLSRARRLCQYLLQHDDHFAEQTFLPGGSDLSSELQAVTFVPCQPCMPLTSDVRLLEEVPPATEALMASKDLLDREHRDTVWAVQATVAVKRSTVLGTTKLRPLHVADQIKALVCYIEQDCLADDVYGAVHHLHQTMLVLARTWPEGSEERANALNRLTDVPWVPCHSDDKSKLAMLLPALVAEKASVDLAPALGILHDRFRMPAELVKLLTGAGVVPKFGVRVLATKLSELRTATAATRSDSQIDQATRLAKELAHQLKSVERDSEGRAAAKLDVPVYVPTRDNQILMASEVYIDDAQWKKSSHLPTLTGDISAAEGCILGCQSIRDKLAAECEEDTEMFGQQECLADRIQQLLNEYQGKEDPFREFFQNTDDHGSADLHFILDTQSYEDEELVDCRAKPLHGPALLVCSRKPLVDSDIRRMQQLGRSEKRKDAAAAGRFGVGMNAMYHLSDCPQLYANDSLHFFDPMHKYVAKPGSSGRKFSVSKLQADFPNQLAPFQDVSADYAVVFRLPLRTKPSDFGRVYSSRELRLSMVEVAKSAGQLLLFSRSVSSLHISARGPDGSTELIAAHKLLVPSSESDIPEVETPTGLESRQRQPEAGSLDVKAQLAGLLSGTSNLSQHSLLQRVIIRSQAGGEAESEQTWSISHTLSNDQELLNLADKLRGGVWRMNLLPHGAVAVCHGDPGRMTAGSVCCSIPLEMKLRVPGVLLHGCFYISSSRKSVPLPPSTGGLPVMWNEALLKGPVALSLASLNAHLKPWVSTDSSSAASAEGLSLERFYDVLTVEGNEGDSEQICRTVVDAAVRSLVDRSVAAFPVVSGAHIRRWTKAPADTRLVSGLTDEAKDFLVDDGMDLVRCRSSVQKQLASVLTPMTPSKLVAFLKTAVVRHNWPVQLADAPLKSLRHKAAELLQFVVSKMTAKRTGNGGLVLADLLGVPLLMLESGDLTTFSAHPVYFTVRSKPLLSDRPELFCTELVGRAIGGTSSDEVFPKAEAAAIGVAQMRAEDLLPFKEEMLPLEGPACRFTDASWLSHFWALLSQQGGGRLMQSELSHWEILPVIVAGQSTLIESCIAPRHAAGTLALHEFDRSQQGSLGDAVLECGIPTLQPEFCKDTNAYGLVSSAAITTDTGLMSALKQLSAQGRLDNLSATSRRSLLKYWFSRPDTGCDSDLCMLPLFLLATEQTGNSKYVRISSPGTHVCIHPEDGWGPQIADLNIPDVVYLDYPPDDNMCGLYRRLGIDMLAPPQFIVKHAIPHLAKLAHDGAPMDRLRPYLQLLHDSCFGTVRQFKEGGVEQVWKALQKVALVATMSSDTPVRCASECVNPDTLVAKAFLQGSAALHPFLPSSEWREDWLLQMLRWLGLRNALPPTAILACASHLDACAAEGVLTAQEERQSCYLVEEIATQAPSMLENIPHGGDAEGSPALIFAEACEKRVLLALDWVDGGTISEVEQEARARAGSAPGPTLKSTKTRVLAPFAGTALPAVEPVSWVVAPTACPPLCDTPPASQSHTVLERLAEKKPSVANSLCLICNSSAPSAEQLVRQLGSMVRATMKEVPTLRLSKACQLVQDLGACLNMLNKRLQNGSSQQLLDCLHELAALPCIPWQIRADASRTSPDQVRLLRPIDCFFHLEEDCMKASGRRFHCVDDNVSIHQVYQALGARKRPGLRDWLAVVNDLEPLWHDMQLPPNEWAVAHASAVRIAELIEKDGMEKPLGDPLFLPTEGKLLVEACRVVWIDSVQLTHRCEGLLEHGFHFVSTDLVPACRDVHLKHLCEGFGMRRVSDLVREEKVGGFNVRDDAPNAEQRRLERILSSEEFRDGIGELAGLDPGCVSVLMEGVKLRWVDRLTTVLVLTESEQPVELPSSENDIPCFCPESDGGDGPELLLSLSSLAKSSSTFHRRLAGQINVLLARASLSLVQDSGDLVEMLECEDPAEIPGRMQELGVAMKSEQECHRVTPGERVDDCFLDHRVLDLNATFHVDEVIIVRVDGADNGGGSYIWAKVVELDEADMASTSYLQRQYRLLVGPCEARLFRHVDVFQISRAAVHPVPDIPLPGQQIVTTQQGEVVSEAEETADMDELKNTLREMAKLDMESYKTAWKRLCMKYRPDKSSYSTAPFVMLKRHQECFKRWKEEGVHFNDADWVGCSSRGADADGDHTATTPFEHECQDPNSFSRWMHEINKEREARRRDRQGPQPSRKPHVFVMNQSSRSGAVRWRDEADANCWFSQALADQVAASCLAKGGHYAHVVWMCQQVAEKLIKATMLRTCGLTDNEMKGRDAHDLKALACLFDKHSLPSDICHELGTLSSAYIAARYPSKGTEKVPAQKYSEAQARRAMGTAEKLVQWCRDVEFLPTPRGSEPGAEIVVRATVLDAEDVELKMPPCPAPTPDPLPPVNLPHPRARDPAVERQAAPIHVADVDGPQPAPLDVEHRHTARPRAVGGAFPVAARFHTVAKAQAAELHKAQVKALTEGQTMAAGDNIYSNWTPELGWTLEHYATPGFAPKYVTKLGLTRAEAGADLMSEQLKRWPEFCKLGGCHIVDLGGGPGSVTYGVAAAAVSAGLVVETAVITDPLEVWRPAIEVLQNDIPAATFFHEPNGLMAMARAPAVTENANIVILSHVLVDFLSPDEAQQFWESLEAEIGSRPAVILVIEGFKYLEKYVQTPSQSTSFMWTKCGGGLAGSLNLP